LLGEYDSAGNAVQETVYLGDTPVAVLKGAEVFYVYADHLHAPRLIADHTNKAVWQWNSDPFGVTLANADPDGDGVLFSYNLRFPGQYFDSETRLHYNYFRDYNPSSGRYIESDPIGLNGGLNTFGYVGGNPLSFVDPLGLINIGPGPLNNELGFGGSGLGGGSFGGRTAGEANYNVYYGTVNGQRTYVGITNDFTRRANEWEGRYDLEKINKSGGLTKDQARAIEQSIINDNPGFNNKINSIGKNRDWYQEAINWAAKWRKKYCE
jgi:RHS repeat-associated protein